MDRVLSDAPLPFRVLFDVGYREFACSRATFEWLVGGAMRVLDGERVRLQIMEECVGGHNVCVMAWPVVETRQEAIAA